MPIFRLPIAENVNGFLRASKTSSMTVARFTWTTIIWNQGTDPSNKVITRSGNDFTCNETGAILINCVVMWSGFTATGFRNFRVWNTTAGAASSGHTFTTGTGAHYISYSVSVNLVEGTVFRLEVYQDSDATPVTILASDSVYGLTRVGMLWAK